MLGSAGPTTKSLAPRRGELAEEIILIFGVSGVGKIPTALTIPMAIGSKNCLVRTAGSFPHFFRRPSGVIGAGTKNPKDQPLATVLILELDDELSQFSNICLDANTVGGGCTLHPVSYVQAQQTVCDLSTCYLMGRRPTAYSMVGRAI